MRQGRYLRSALVLCVALLIIALMAYLQPHSYERANVLSYPPANPLSTKRL